MFKLEVGPTGQFASRGNVCVFAQDPGPLVTTLPPPLSQLHDEICVILVGSPDTEVTAELLEKTPLLVRCNKIIQALIWLIRNNPLYSDLNVDEIRLNASSYPDHGIPIPIRDFICLFG